MVITDCPYIDRPIRATRERVCPLEVVWGWQGIAELLDASADTAKRWADKYGLPVRRKGDDQGPVFMIVAEYNEWLKGGPRGDRDD